jgi:hypothetical protein
MRALVAGNRGNVGAVIGSFLQRAGHHIVGLDAGSYDGCNSELAARVATDAGGLSRRLCDAGSMADANGLRDAGGRAANRFATAELSAARPDDAVFSEEPVDDGVRLKANRVWIIDPLDGTREFADGGGSDLAVRLDSRWPRSSSARSVRTCTPEASSSRTPPRRSRWPVLRGCTPPGWMAIAWSTTGLTRIFLTYWSAARSSPQRCWPPAVPRRGR